MKRLLALLVVVVSPLLVTVLPDAADTRLMDAVRRADAVALRAALAGGADPNTPDETGATALMYASLYATATEMRLLTDAGANVDAANAFQSTALMWAAGDTSAGDAKVRLLLDRGAAINARAVDRTTALLVATRLRNTNAMRLLIERGAAITSPPDVVALLTAAYSGTASNDVRQVLAEHGVALKSATQIGIPAIPFNQQDSVLVKQLLDAGADPKLDMDVTTLTLPSLALAASRGSLDTARLLIERGADPNRAGSHGYTPLMLSTVDIHAGPRVATLLLDNGATINARDEDGRTALDWAELSGHTALTKLLRDAGGKSTAMPAPAPAPIATPRRPRDAVAKAVTNLQPISPAFYDHYKCISCHNMSLPAMLVKIAGDRGVPFDRTLAAHPTTVTTTTWKDSREKVLLGDNRAVGGFAANLSYGLVAMAEEGVPPNAVTDAMAYGLAMDQRADGSFLVPGPSTIRPPLGGFSLIHLTALSIRALSVYAAPGRQADTQARIARAVTRLRTAPVDDTQDLTLRLLGFIWAAVPATERAANAKALIALQRADGGWGQLPTMTSDAYATGQTLYALHANGMAPTDNVYKRGVAFLLRTQLEDGSWFVRARGFGFQPYFDAGFPHGRDQFISAAATSWAAMALAYTF